MPHVETCVSVNAWVDEGVAPLVEALNSWPGVVTVDSCEYGAAGTGAEGLAYVTFTAGNDTRSVESLAQSIAVWLSKMSDCLAVLALEWSYGGELPLAWLKCPPGEVQRLAQHLWCA